MHQSIHLHVQKYWKEFFNIKNLKDFSCIIKTDGNSVSILYDKEREIKVKKNNKKEKDISNINIDDHKFYKKILIEDPASTQHVSYTEIVSRFTLNDFIEMHTPKLLGGNFIIIFL